MRRPIEDDASERGDLRTRIVNDDVPSMKLAMGVSDVRAVTAGANWWRNRHSRTMVNYVLTSSDDPLDRSLTEHLVLLRAQFEL